MTEPIKQIKRSLFATIFVVMLGCAWPIATVSAIARGYNTSDDKLQVGMVAALNVSSSDSNSIERATQDNGDHVVGVVTTVDNSLVTVSPGSVKVFVESEGQVIAYVSDMNGAVNKGDKLVVSPLRGVLMNAGSGLGTIIGIAADNLKTTMDYDYQEGGQTKTTQIGKVTIDLNSRGGSTNTTGADSSLSKLGRALVGRPVSDIRVVTALAVFLVVLMVEGAFLYGAISTSITAMGRNPLARHVIRRELLRVCLIAFAVLIIGLAAVYAIVWI